jgi:hypothetical protein
VTIALPIRALALMAVLVVLSPLAPAHGAPAPIEPYFPPPFGDSCVVHQFGEGEVPKLRSLPDDPLCVEYAKRDITISNGGAIRFILAEPARFALVAGKCQYWQQDHWSVQLRPGATPVIRWDGSYWLDLGAGQAGARLSGLAIAGRPATLEEAAKYAARFSPALAAFFRQYGQGGDGGAVRLGIPIKPGCA